MAMHQKFKLINNMRIFVCGCFSAAAFGTHPGIPCSPAASGFRGGSDFFTFLLPINDRDLRDFCQLVELFYASPAEHF